MDLQGKCVLLGVTGGIAAYKMANVASALKKLGADVEVIMTENATHFITPLVFETLTGHKCMVDTFDRDFKFEVTHISLAKKADVVLVAPATANVIAKMAHGIADDMLTTVVLAARCPKLVSPAMNTGMLENPITQDNLRTLEHYGFTVIPSESGVLACKDVGSGRLPKEDVLIEYILHTIARPKDLAGVRIAVTAGPTQEPLDPVRYLTNHSTGKMGYAIARAAAMRGAEVTLINLLMRFYDVNGGSIEVAGNDIRSLTRASLRGSYGMVLQETWLRAGTVRENIAYGKPDATEEEIVAAAKAAHADSFIRRLPKGYDTVIAEDGGNISQGQKQLLCIARVMLCLPPMLILDEATSSIDTRTEVRIQAAFARMMQGRTSFIVAHRLSTIREADVILVMKDGHIVEQGDHDTLLAQGGFYAKLYNSQFEGVET